MNSRARILALPLATLLIGHGTPSHAAPAIGFIERWNAPPSNSTWLSNAENTNPGAGGAGGAGDGYLRIARSVFAPLGAYSDGPEYKGNWLVANVNRIHLSLNDVDANQALEIHVSIGNQSNLWQYKTGFSPPEHAWAQFTVDLTDSTQFSHIIALDGKGFAAALQNADRVLVRHDLAPFSQTPDSLIGDFGLDDFELTSSLLDAGTPGGATAGRPVELAAPYPNPARGAVACVFETFEAGPVRVSVFDAAGRLVRSETLASTAPGRRTWVWDGRDEAGRVAPAGSYRVRVVGSSGGTSRPFVRLP
jgi:flagellar basal-body rod modification protein FlgD